MSFGQAASSRAGVRRVVDDAPCPCGSGDLFSTCCGPLLDGYPAPTAERLMRSRYTAFFLGDARYLEQSWHPRTRPDQVAIDTDLRWTGLRIDATAAGGVGDSTGVVEFTASWVEGAASARGTLHERSRFVHQGGRWWYLEGEID